MKYKFSKRHFEICFCFFFFFQKTGFDRTWKWSPLLFSGKMTKYHQSAELAQKVVKVMFGQSHLNEVCGGEFLQLLGYWFTCIICKTKPILCFLSWHFMLDNVSYEYKDIWRTCSLYTGRDLVNNIHYCVYTGPDLVNNIYIALHRSRSGKQYGASQFKEMKASYMLQNLPHSFWFWTFQYEWLLSGKYLVFICCLFELITNKIYGYQNICRNARKI